LPRDPVFVAFQKPRHSTTGTQDAAKPSVKFCGTFEGGKSYTPGDAVVHSSALWICKVATQGTPSRDFVGWQLALKKGDAR
jgi:hypothetical protein